MFLDHTIEGIIKRFENEFPETRQSVDLATSPQDHSPVWPAGGHQRTFSMSSAEGDAILARYQQQHPGAWEKLAAIIVKATGDPDPDIPLVRLSLRAEPAAGRGCQRGPTLRLCPDTRADSETCPAG